MRRFIRKHRAAILALAVYNLVFFFPVLFMGRVVSPNDVFYNYDPWAFERPHSVVGAQNPLINDPPTAYLTLMSLAKGDWSAFHWNPYVGAGIPGFGSSAAAVLSPFILAPVVLLPLKWAYTAIIFLKLNVAFLFAYLWLREERLGKAGAAVGATVASGAGILAVRWLWQLTNAASLYPMLFLLVRRAFNGKRTPASLVTVGALAYALAGFPATMAYGVYLALAYAIFIAVRTRSLPWRSLAPLIVGGVLSIVLAAPSLVPFAQLIKRSGYLEMREATSRSLFYPLSMWRGFFAPERLGSPAYKNWVGDPALGIINNNFLDATVYVGLASMLLLVPALLNRRARARWFWVASLVVLVAAMTGAPVISSIFSAMPGLKYSGLTRLVMLLPIVFAYLAAAGLPRLVALVPLRVAALRTAVVLLLVIFNSADLAVFAGRFHPYLAIDDADVPSTPVIDFLQAQPRPYRYAAFFNYLWPNASELFRIEDVRSHFGSEADYRKLLQRIDPTAWGGRSTVIQFNSLKYDFNDPLAGLLGIRYYIEHPSIDIIKWSTFAATVPGVKETGTVVLKPGIVWQRTIGVTEEPFWAIELPASIERQLARTAHLDVDLIRGDRVVWQRAFTPQDITAMNKLYIPLRPYARLGETVTLRLRSFGMNTQLLRGEAPAGEAPVFYGRVKMPVIFERQLRDGRVFRNLAELPRFRAASTLRAMRTTDFLATKSLDLEHEAILTGSASSSVEAFDGAARVTLASYRPAEQRLRVDAAGPAFVASSEKLTPELRITVDGAEAAIVPINMVFAGVRVPAGAHEVVFSRRIARGIWWPLAAVALVVWLGIAAAEVTASLRRR